MELDVAAFAHERTTSRYGGEGLRSSCDPLGSRLECLFIFCWGRGFPAPFFLHALL